MNLAQDDLLCDLVGRAGLAAYLDEDAGHGCASFRRKRWIMPLSVFGKPSQKTMRRGSL
jgi:hypothetical protein